MIRDGATTLLTIEAFCRSFEHGSFTAAARVLGITPQAVSKAVARLEQALAVPLFRRTTRHVVPTEAARRYYARSVEALGLLRLAESSLGQERASPRGVVRISVPTTYGHHAFLPSLGAFRDRHPEVEVEVEVANHNVDLVRDGFDMAIRLGTPRDASLVARSLGELPLGVFAAPAYLARYGQPRDVQDLERHTCIPFVIPSSGRVLPWSFRTGAWTPPLHGSHRCREDVLGNVTLARAGVGLVHMFVLVVRDALVRSELVEVLKDERGPGRRFSLVYPRQGKLAPPARALAEHVLEHSRSMRRDG